MEAQRLGVLGSIPRSDLEVISSQTSSVQHQGSGFDSLAESLHRDARNEGHCFDHWKGHSVKTPVNKKGTTKKRMVLDMSRLNKFIPCPKFRMTTAKSVRRVIAEGAWMVTGLEECLLARPDSSQVSTTVGLQNRLCPVLALKCYLGATKSLNVTKLLINPATLVPCTALAITNLLRKLVRISQLGIYCAFHDLRKFATSKAFFALMSCRGIRSRGGWASNRTFASRYF